MTILTIFTLMAFSPFLLIPAGVDSFNFYSYTRYPAAGWDVDIFEVDGWSLISFGRSLDRPYFHIGNVDLIG